MRSDACTPRSERARVSTRRLVYRHVVAYPFHPCVAMRAYAHIHIALHQFNVLWLNPESPETFPEGLLDALDEPALVTSIQKHQANQSIEGRLRAKMQADALRPLKSSLEDVDADDSAEKVGLPKSPYSEEDLQEAVQLLRLGVSLHPWPYASNRYVIDSADCIIGCDILHDLQAQDRLTLVLDYLRRKYAYCFWCGTQYDDAEDMENNCPGPNEDAHD